MVDTLKESIVEQLKLLREDNLPETIKDAYNELLAENFRLRS